MYCATLQSVIAQAASEPICLPIKTTKIRAGNATDREETSMSPSREKPPRSIASEIRARIGDRSSAALTRDRDDHSGRPSGPMRAQNLVLSPRGENRRTRRCNDISANLRLAVAARGIERSRSTDVCQHVGPRLRDHGFIAHSTGTTMRRPGERCMVCAGAAMVGPTRALEPTGQNFSAYSRLFGPVRGASPCGPISPTL
jgi:hypothetical protein